MRRRLALLAALSALAAGLTAPAAHADGDPASDVLLSADAYYPYAPNGVSKNLQTALDRMLSQAKAKGFELKVAMIAATADLGAVPQLITDPQKYADLLTSEIAFNTKPRVLVVLPAGLGGNNLGDNAGEALVGITPDGGDGGDGLARAAMVAVGKLTAANGTPVPIPAVARDGGKGNGKDGGSRGTPAVIIFGVPVLLVALAAGGLALAGRGRADDGDTDADSDGEDPDAADGTPPAPE